MYLFKYIGIILRPLKKGNNAKISNTYHQSRKQALYSEIIRAYGNNEAWTASAETDDLNLRYDGWNTEDRFPERCFLRTISQLAWREYFKDD